jgi:two-component system, NtrC family, response regulator AtoC
MTTETIPVTAEPTDRPPDFVSGCSAPMAALNAMVEGLAQANIPVLIVGESGTGKDVYAKRLHQLSSRSSDLFEKIGCASMEESQIRERLQAIARTPSGAAPAGTLFLDGIHELGPALQKYLLALLDSPGSAWNSRIVSSAPLGIERDVEAGRFRGELYFRLKGARLRLPPLRERKEDIPVLLEYFLAKHERELNRCGLVVGQTELEALAAYDWPGNVRELENLAKKMIAVASTRIDPRDFPSAVLGRNGSLENVPLSPLKVAARKALRRTERELILDALTRTHWNRKKAAQELQISYKSLLYKIKQIGAEQEEILRLERS